MMAQGRVVQWGRRARRARQHGALPRVGHAAPTPLLPSRHGQHPPMRSPQSSIMRGACAASRRPAPRLPEQQGDAAALQLKRVDQTGHRIAGAPLLLHGRREGTRGAYGASKRPCCGTPPSAPLSRPAAMAESPRRLLPGVQRARPTWRSGARTAAGQRRAARLDHARQVAPVHARGHSLAHSVQRSVYSVQIVLYQGSLRGIPRGWGPRGQGLSQWEHCEGLGCGVGDGGGLGRRGTLPLRQLA